MELTILKIGSTNSKKYMQNFTLSHQRNANKNFVEILSPVKWLRKQTGNIGGARGGSGTVGEAVN